MTSKSTNSAPKAYWKQYWNEKRQEILNSRRTRYADDEGYREQMKKIREDNYRKNRITKSKEPEKIVSPDVDPVIMKIDGNTELMFDIGYFSKKIGKSEVTIRYWERHEMIPTSTFVNEGRGHRKLYSMTMINSVYEALSEQGFPAKIDIEKFKIKVRETWR